MMKHMGWCPYTIWQHKEWDCPIYSQMGVHVGRYTKNAPDCLYCTPMAANTIYIYEGEGSNRLQLCHSMQSVSFTGPLDILCLGT
ncbi:hypothetical protein GDO81_012823 [Engystomops pustulosus]|uniref:Uncharacterized protein n=1 Tax=Engystomops pustulosus TaxID=76066 RepID=A0AAV7AW36_ENGPU|nr:hypothetical protein GDO81_012823 [Engystomops pustulosus]